MGADQIRRRPSTFNEHFEKVIDEQFQEVYDWEIMHMNEHSEPEQLYELEGIAALEKLSLVQDQIERSYPLQTLQKLAEEKQHTEGPPSENSVHTQAHHIEIDSTSQSLDSKLYHLEQVQQLDDMQQSSKTQLHQAYIQIN